MWPSSYLQHGSFFQVCVYIELSPRCSTSLVRRGTTKKKTKHYITKQKSFEDTGFMLGACSAILSARNTFSDSDKSPRLFRSCIARIIEARSSAAWRFAVHFVSAECVPLRYEYACSVVGLAEHLSKLADVPTGMRSVNTASWALDDGVVQSRAGPWLDIFLKEGGWTFFHACTVAWTLDSAWHECCEGRRCAKQKLAWHCGH